MDFKNTQISNTLHTHTHTKTTTTIFCWLQKNPQLRQRPIGDILLWWSPIGWQEKEKYHGWGLSESLPTVGVDDSVLDTGSDRVKKMVFLLERPGSSVKYIYIYKRYKCISKWNQRLQEDVIDWTTNLKKNIPLGCFFFRDFRALNHDVFFALVFLSHCSKPGNCNPCSTSFLWFLVKAPPASPMFQVGTFSTYQANTWRNGGLGA